MFHLGTKRIMYVCTKQTEKVQYILFSISLSAEDAQCWYERDKKPEMAGYEMTHVHRNFIMFGNDSCLSLTNTK